MKTIHEVTVQEHEKLRQATKELLTKNPTTSAELAEALKVHPSVIKRIIRELRNQGANFIQTGERLFLNNYLERGGRLQVKPKDRGDGWTVFGFITDKHLNNRQERLDVLGAAYDHFAAEGVTQVFDGGNWIDGEARFNRQELLNFGMDRQLAYAIDKHPTKPGITTYFVSGDDHEGWYAQRECINIGQYFQMKAEKAGRNDLQFIGHVEADVELVSKGGSAVMKIMHPGGGSSYAFSYAPQKIVESFQGGEKPAVVLGGHYHKFDYCFPREVHFVSGGCVVDQTMFMRKNKIAAHVGYSIIKIKQDPLDGHIQNFGLYWNPFYDRSFYAHRF